MFISKAISDRPLDGEAARPQLEAIDEVFRFYSIASRVNEITGEVTAFIDVSLAAKNIVPDCFRDYISGRLDQIDLESFETLYRYLATMQILHLSRDTESLSQHFFYQVAGLGVYLNIFMIPTNENTAKACSLVSVPEKSRAFWHDSFVEFFIGYYMSVSGGQTNNGATPLFV